MKRNSRAALNLSITGLACLASMFCVPRLPAQNVLTWHNDAARTGQNLAEALLSPSNVNSASFGLKFTLPVDGKVDAQPLYVPAVSISGVLHNVLYVATENDTLYAFDADSGGSPLWSKSVALSGESASDDRGCNQVTPQIGITATPAIDLARGPNGTIYLVAMSKDVSGNYHQRLHALDLATGVEQSGWPILIQATYPGNGPNSSGGVLTFDPKQYKDRAALLISNGVVYTSWASHCDVDPYNGWVIGYNQSTGAKTVLNLTPNGSDPQRGAIWMAGAGPAADAGGNVYFLMGNGTFDTALNANGFPSQGDYGNAFMNLSTTTGLAVADYFTMDNTVNESDTDEDLGSGGGMLLPILNDAMGNPHELAVGAGKDGTAYVVDRNNMGKFNMNSNVVYQQLGLGASVFSSPAWFNNTLYYGAVGKPVTAYHYSGGSFGSSAQSSTSFGYPGTTPSISANGTSNGIVWAVKKGSPPVLYAFDATTLTELYDSTGTNFGSGITFATPTVANGKVYVGTTNSVGVFGLLHSTNNATTVSVAPNSGSGSSQTFALQYSDAAGAASLQQVWMYFNTTLAYSGSNACLLYYQSSTNQINLLNDSGTAWQPATLGTATTLQNSQCSLNVAATTVGRNGNTLTWSVPMTFKPAFAGAKNVYLKAVDISGSSSAWQQLGAWTIAGGSGTPAPVSVTPSSGSGASHSFALQYSDTSGAGSLQQVWVYFNATLAYSGSNACLLYYQSSTNQLNLLNDSGTAWQPATLGTATTLQNSQCSLNVATSTVGVNGSTFTWNVAMTFKPAFAGAKNVYLKAVDISGSSSAWQALGAWTVPSGTGTPSAVSVTPSLGTGASHAFAFRYSDTAGAGSLQQVWVYFNATLANPASHACMLYYQSSTNQINLLNDNGTAWQVATLGAATTLQNSQCSLNAAAATVTPSGNTLTWSVTVTFKPAFAGGRNVYLHAVDSGSNSGWQSFGGWTVP